jgi:hypothetical protein
LIFTNKRPKLVDKENFDFKTANLGVGTLSELILEPNVDPSQIGRTVYFEFDNRANLPFGSYNQTDFNSDVARENSLQGFNPATLNAAMLDEAGKLFDAGTTKFLYKDKQIFYGTVGNDSLTASSLIKSDVAPEFRVPRGDVNFSNGLVLLGGKGDDILTGDAFALGNTDDIVAGQEGNDRLDGGGGEDTAIFSDNFEYYDIETTGTLTKTTTITSKYNSIDGTDSLKNIEWGIFNGEQIPLGNARLASATTPAPRIIPLPLEDGELETETVKATDTTANPSVNDPLTPPYVSLTAPVAMLDGNVDYTLNISPYKPDNEYNIVYIFDTSLSMSASELQTAKDAYTDLTTYFINQGLAENINFGLVSFDDQAVLQTDSSGSRNLTADEAIAAIQGLTTATVIGTDYDAGLWEGINFLTTSPLKPSFPTNPGGTTSISYFFSDGQSSSDRFTMLNTAKTLRRYANVQAFGLNNLSPIVANDINFIDSNNGVMMSSIADLSTELSKSGLAGKVSQVNILLDGVVVDTIQPSELTDSPLGLTYEGSVENLDVSVDAKNIVTAEVVFNDSTATTNLDFTVTTGEGELIDGNNNPIDESGGGNNEDPLERIRNGGDTNDDITLGYADRGANGGAGGDYIVGNKRDNILDGGDGNDTIMGHGGNDTIITGAGTNKIDGGEGIDTVLYGNVAYQGNTSIFLRQAANTVSYNNTDTLTGVEFIQFSDVRISAKTLQVTPILQGNDVNVTETKTGTTTAEFTFNLSTPAPVDVQFNYNTVDGDALAGADYIAKSGQVTIAAGNTSATVAVEVMGDTQYDESTETFALNLSSISGATFANNQTEYSVAANIENRPGDLNLVGDAGQNTLTGGQGNDLIDGQGNNDYLAGEAGNDTVI